MTFLHKFFLLALMASITLTACKRENIDEIVPDDPQFEPVEVDVNTLIDAMKPTTSEGMSLDCITVLYPFDLKTVSEKTVSISSEADFRAAVSTQSADPAVDFLFPLEVTGASGKQFQVFDNAELGKRFAACTPQTGWKTNSATSGGAAIPAFLFDSLCFDLVYPVSLEDQNGAPYTANTEGDFVNLVATVDSLFFTLPLTVDTSGVQVSINTQTEFLDLVYICHGISAPIGGSGLTFEGFCYKLLYPFDALLPDSTTVVTVNDENDYAALVLEGEQLELIYPFSLEDSAGMVTVINDDTAFLMALVDCGIVQIDTITSVCDVFPAHAQLFFNEGASGCGFQVNYPAQVTAEGVTYTVNDLNEYMNVYSMYQSRVNEIDLVYPVSITTISGGNVITFTSDSEVCAYIDGC